MPKVTQPVHGEPAHELPDPEAHISIQPDWRGQDGEAMALCGGLARQDTASPGRGVQAPCWKAFSEVSFWGCGRMLWSGSEHLERLRGHRLMAKSQGL